MLLGKDIDDLRTKEGIRRAVVFVLRETGLLPPAPKRSPKLRIVKDE